MPRSRCSKKGLLLGWEAGIRTPITWPESGEWVALRAGPLWFVPVFGVIPSVCSPPLCFVHAQDVSLCLRAERTRRRSTERLAAISPTNINNRLESSATLHRRRNGHCDQAIAKLGPELGRIVKTASAARAPATRGVSLALLHARNERIGLRCRVGLHAQRRRTAQRMHIG
jgi:hypothetical protein